MLAEIRDMAGAALSLVAQRKEASSERNLQMLSLMAEVERRNPEVIIGKLFTTVGKGDDRVLISTSTNYFNDMDKKELSDIDEFLCIDRFGFSVLMLERPNWPGGYVLMLDLMFQPDKIYGKVVEEVSLCGTLRAGVARTYKGEAISIEGPEAIDIIKGLYDRVSHMQGKMISTEKSTTEAARVLLNTTQV